MAYGYLSPRRKSLLNKLSEEVDSDGNKLYPNIVHYGRVSMSELQRLIRISKWVLSVGSYEGCPNDSFRATPALNFGARLITENFPEKWYMDYLELYFSDRIKILKEEYFNE